MSHISFEATQTLPTLLYALGYFPEIPTRPFPWHTCRPYCLSTCSYCPQHARHLTQYSLLAAPRGLDASSNAPHSPLSHAPLSATGKYDSQQ
jgi:hypothetical protein